MAQIRSYALVDHSVTLYVTSLSKSLTGDLDVDCRLKPLETTILPNLSYLICKCRFRKRSYKTFLQCIRLQQTRKQSRRVQVRHKKYVSEDSVAICFDFRYKESENMEFIIKMSLACLTSKSRAATMKNRLPSKIFLNFCDSMTTEILVYYFS